MTTLTAATKIRIHRVGGVSMDLSVVGGGVDGWQETDTRRTRPLPSIPGSIQVQLLDLTDTSIALGVDDNATTSPEMFMRSGETFGVELRVKGDGAGLPNKAWSGPATINGENNAGAARRWTIAIPASKTVTETVQ